jgi:hypothetical protein
MKFSFSLPGAQNLSNKTVGHNNHLKHILMATMVQMSPPRSVSTLGDHCPSTLGHS